MLPWPFSRREDLRRQTLRPRAQLAPRRRRRADARPARDPDRRRAARQAQAEYTPHIDTGDFVVVVNAEKIAVTGNKRADKMYYRHTGYPGGLKTRTLNDMLERRPEEVIRIAVKGMLPRNRLARKQLTKLKVYAGPEHPHVAQKPHRWRSSPDGRRRRPRRRRAAASPRRRRPRRPRPLRRPPAAEEAAPGRGGRCARRREELRRPPEAAAAARRRRGGRRRGRARSDDEDAAEDDETPREKPAIPGADLEVDIVLDSDDQRSQYDEDADGRRVRPATATTRTSSRTADRRRPRSTSPPARATARPASARPPSPA